MSSKPLNPRNGFLFAALHELLADEGFREPGSVISALEALKRFPREVRSAADAAKLHGFTAGVLVRLTTVWGAVGGGGAGSSSVVAPPPAAAAAARPAKPAVVAASSTAAMLLLSDDDDDDVGHEVDLRPLAERLAGPPPAKKAAAAAKGGKPASSAPAPLEPAAAVIDLASSFTSPDGKVGFGQGAAGVMSPREQRSARRAAGTPGSGAMGSKRNVAAALAASAAAAASSSSAAAATKAAPAAAAATTGSSAAPVPRGASKSSSSSSSPTSAAAAAPPAAAPMSVNDAEVAVTAAATTVTAWACPCCGAAYRWAPLDGRARAMAQDDDDDDGDDDSDGGDGRRGRDVTAAPGYGWVREAPGRRASGAPTAAPSCAAGTPHQRQAQHTCALDGGFWEVVLLLDCREKRDRRDPRELERLLLGRGVPVEVRQLPLGDMLWVARRRAGAPSPPVPPPPPAAATAAGEDTDDEEDDAATAAAAAAAGAKKGGGGGRKRKAADGDGGDAKPKKGGGGRKKKAPPPEAPPPWGAAAKPGCREWVLPFVVERKAALDLAASLVDGRYAEQKGRLADTGLRAVYVCEGDLRQVNKDAAARRPPWGGAGSGAGAGGGIGGGPPGGPPFGGGVPMRGAITSKHLSGALVSIQVHGGFGVVCTPSLEATVEWVARMHASLVGAFVRGAACQACAATGGKGAGSSAAPLRHATDAALAALLPPPASQHGGGGGGLAFGGDDDYGGLLSQQSAALLGGGSQAAAGGGGGDAGWLIGGGINGGARPPWAAAAGGGGGGSAFGASQGYAPSNYSQQQQYGAGAASSSSSSSAAAAASSTAQGHLCGYDRCNLLGRAGQPRLPRSYRDFAATAAKARAHAARDLLGMMLRQVPGVSSDRAEALLARAPVPAALADVFDGLGQWRGRDGPGLLRGLAVPRQRNTLGPAVSAAVYHVFNDVPPAAGGAAAAGGGGGGGGGAGRAASSAAAAAGGGGGLGAGFDDDGDFVAQLQAADWY